MQFRNIQFPPIRQYSALPLQNGRLPNGYWNNKENVNKFLENLEKKYQLNSSKDWIKLKATDIKSSGGRGLLRKYTLFEIKCLKNKDYHLIKPKIKPKKYWENQNNINKFLEKLKNHYNLKTIEDWKKLNYNQIMIFGGSRLLAKYSVNEIKQLGCPEIKIKYPEIKKITHVPKGYWENEENVKNFINKLTKELNLTTENDWIKLNSNDIKKLGGSVLLQRYSIQKIKKIGFPAYNFSKKEKKPKGFWNNDENIKNSIEKLKVNLGDKTIEEWSQLKRKDLIPFRVNSLLNKISFQQLKFLCCPELKINYPNCLIKKPIKSKHYWKNHENIKKFMIFLEKKLFIQSTDDWVRISKKQIKFYGGAQLVSEYSISELLSIAFPDTNWDHLNVTQKHKRSNQRWLFLQIQKIYKNVEIIEDYFHDQLTRISGFPVQFDIFIPSKNVAIEYHGKQHYEDIPNAFANVETYIQRDNEKTKICKQNGIQLITVPYWWDNNINSLKQIINSENLSLINHDNHDNNDFLSAENPKFVIGNPDFASMKILISVCVHGDEYCGLVAFNELIKEGFFKNIPKHISVSKIHHSFYS